MERNTAQKPGNIDINDFRQCWNNYIMSLKKDQRLSNSRGGYYRIIEVDDNKITRLATSNNRTRTISFKKCQEVYNALIKNGHISNKEIRATIELWASAFIISLLKELPHVVETSNPRGLELK